MRGTTLQIQNRFETRSLEAFDDGWETKFELVGTPASDVAARISDQKPITIDRAKTRFRFTYTVTYADAPPTSR